MIEFHNRKSLIFRAWFHVLIALVLISILALLFLSLSDDAKKEFSIVIYTAIVCAIASSIGIILINNVSKYPGVEELSYTIPSFFLSYGIATVVLLFLRIPYSRFILLGSFVINIVLFGALFSFLRQRVNLVIGVVPEGEYTRLTNARGVNWRVLEGIDTEVADLDAVSADLWADLPDEWERQLASYAVQGMPVYHSKHLRESLTGRVEIERLSENTFGTLSPLYTYMKVKRICDVIVAIIALILLAPVLVLVGILVRLDSEGPAIFRQTRIGYRGRPFRVFKFRTMTVDRNDIVENRSAREAAMTQDNDQRITRFGKFLRRTRIDELPQIINIIKGDMSWIGPRPEAQVLSQWYESEIPFYSYRHIVRPGITGWAQVHQGHVAAVDEVQEKLHFDFYYIKNFSPWIDVVVAARTVRIIFTGFGSR